MSTVDSMFAGGTEPPNLITISKKHYLINTGTYKTPYDNSVMPPLHENRASEE